MSEFIKLLIINEEAGVFFPQNQEYVKRNDLVKTIAEVNGKRSFQTKLFNPVIKRLLNINIVDKVFGNLAYD